MHSRPGAGSAADRRDPPVPLAEGAPLIEVDEEAAVRLTRDLVRMRTVSEPDADEVEGPAVSRLARLFTEFGWAHEVTEPAPGRRNLVAVVEGGGGDGPTLMFEGHTDVVTEGRRADWSVDPYAGEIRDGRLWGRGSADMKSGLASMIHAVRGLELAGPFPGRIVLGVLCDEEGMMLGAKAFAASPWAAGVDGVIVCEPEGYEVCTSARGGIRLRLELTGVMAHGAMPQEARSPLVAGARIVEALAGVEEWAVARFGTHRHAGAVTVTPTVLHAGDPAQLNVIPAHGLVGVDVRTVPGTGHEELIAEVRRAAVEAAATAGVTVELTVVDDRPAIEIAEDHPVVTALAAGHRDVHGSAPAFGAVPGTTDGTILTRDAGLPTVVYGPGGKWIAHQKDEFVEVAEIGEYARVYAAAARRFLTAGAGGATAAGAGAR